MFLPLEEEPELSNLVVSDITSEGFTFSWTAEDGAFEYFIIDIRDSESSLDPIQQVLSGKTRTTDVSGLIEGSGYQINVTGVTQGWHTPPLTAATATGTSLKNVQQSLLFHGLFKLAVRIIFPFEKYNRYLL